MGNERDKDQKLKDSSSPSTKRIQQMLLHGQAAESALPDHLLSQGSLERKRRVNNKTYLEALNARITELEIEIMVKQAEIKFQEDAEFFRQMAALEEKAASYRDLIDAYNRKQLSTIRAFLEEELRRLQIMKDNLILMHKSIVEFRWNITNEIDKLKTEITALKEKDGSLRREYSVIFDKCMAEGRNAFRPIAVKELGAYPVDFSKEMAHQYQWSIDIDAQAFVQLTERISNVIRTQDVSLKDMHQLIRNETEGFLQEKLISSLDGYPNIDKASIAEKLSKTTEIQRVVTNLTDQIENAVQRNEASAQLRDIVSAQDSIVNEIAEKEQTVKMLEKKLSMLDKYQEAMENAGRVCDKMLEEKRGDPASLDEFMKSSHLLVEEAFKSGNLSLENIELEDPFADATESLSPRMK